MKKRIQEKPLMLISAASLIYTLWLYSRGLLQAMVGGVEGPNAFYPWLNEAAARQLVRV